MILQIECMTVIYYSDQNLYDNLNGRYKDLLPEQSLVKLGPKYAILRPEFHAAKKFLRKRTGEIERIFVFFGGHDCNE